MRNTICLISILSALSGLLGCSLPSPYYSQQAERYNLPPIINLSEYISPQEIKSGQNSSISAVAAISGGGHRSANFAMGVLLELEKNSLLKEIDYFSTVSGGGFAAAAYISSLYDHLEKTNYDYSTYSLNRSFEDKIKYDIETGYHFTAAASSLRPKTWGNKFDRGDYLERKIDNQILGRKEREKSLLLKHIFIPKKHSKHSAPTLPYMIINGTVFGHGNRESFPFTPDILSKYNVVGCNHRVKRIEFSKGLDGKRNTYELPISVAIKASASYPAGIPPTHLFCEEANGNEASLFITDGGLYDHTGVETAITILDQEPKDNKRILLIIDANKKKNTPFYQSAGTPSCFAVGFDVGTHAGLYSRYMNVKKRVEEFRKNSGTRVIYLKLGDVLREVENGNPKMADITLKFGDTRLRGRGSFNVTPSTQNELVKAGRAIVNHKISELKNLFGK